MHTLVKAILSVAIIPGAAAIGKQLPSAAGLIGVMPLIYQPLKASLL